MPSPSCEARRRASKMKPAGNVPHLRAPKTRFEAIEADPDAVAWRHCASVALREVVTGGAPSQPTHVRAAWNDREWRILFDAEDACPWATINVRDGRLWTEESLEIFVDPVGDLESYFEIEINPLNTVTDLVLRRTCSGWRKEFRWDAIGLSTHVRRTPSGWAAEFAIPFGALTAERPSPGDQWRVNFLRVDRPGGPGSDADLSAWSPTGSRNFHRPECFGVVEFEA